MLLTLLTAAWACSACSTGDPTLTVVGVDKPFAGRVRLSSAYAYRWETDELGHSDRHELDLGVSWAPARWIVLTGIVPIVSAAAHGIDLSEQRGTGLGDVQIGTRLVVGRDRTGRHLGGFTLGLELPTTTAATREDGSVAPPDAQPGAGAWTPALGAWYTGFFGPWALFSSGSLRSPTAGIEDRRVGLTGLATVAVQWQPHPRVAPRLSLDVRAAAPDRVDETLDANTGGWLLQVTPALTVKIAEEVLWTAQLGLPVAQRLGDGDVREGLSPGMGIIVDL